ncbi:MAG: NAD(P)H-hydrate epimerase [Pirellulales bacterium]|nr:NAD(P)H-hydrate epimerase [Pirellulales bacterium]
MPLPLTSHQIREIDRQAIADYGMSGLVLMENAGRGAATLLYRLMEEDDRAHDPVAIVCGKGNNGGDGFVIARHLDFRGIAVKVLLLADPNDLRGDAATNFRILEKAELPIQIFDAPLDLERFDRELLGSAWLVDAMLGTGASGEPRSPYAEAIDRMNAAGVPIFAVDLPSGLNCDTGQPAQHTIRATATCTFVAPKPGFFTSSGAAYRGQLYVEDIGVPRRLLYPIQP